MKKIISLIIFLFLTSSVYAVEEVDEVKDVYYLNQCIKIAIQNSPILKKAKYNLEVSKLDTKIAKSDFFPILGIGANYFQYINSDKRYDDGYSKRLLPDVSVYLQQLIYDFGKTNANIDMRKMYTIVAEYEYSNTLNETINAVQSAYFNVLEAKAAVDIAEYNLYISDRLVKYVKDLYEENKKTEVDYIDAQINYLDAEIDLTDRKNSYNIALADLCNKMYIDDKIKFKIKEINEFYYVDAYFEPDFLKTKNEKLIYKKPDNIPSGEEVIYDVDLKKLPFNLDEAYEMAYKDNPKLKALENTLKAMEKYALTKKREYYPSLKYKIGYNRGDKYISQKSDIHNNQLNIGVTLNTNVNILQTQSEINKADYMIKQVESDIEAYKTNIYYDIQKNYMEIETAQKQISIAKEKIKRTTESLDALIYSYLLDTEGAGYLEFQNARKNYNDAKLEYIARLKIYNNSLANLQKLIRVFNVQKL